MKSIFLILHGWGLTGATFAPLAQELKKRGYRVFAPDLPGFGESRALSRPMTLGDYARFVHRYLRRNKIAHPILIGHSFGGRVSLRFYQLYPKSVRALILSGTPGFRSISKKRFLLFVSIAKIGKLLCSLMPFCLVRESIRGWYYAFVGAREYTRAWGPLRETFKNVVSEDLVGAMEGVNVPTLLLWGEHDRVTPVSIAERMHRAIVGSELVVIPQSDHSVPFTKPEIFASYVAQFTETWNR